MPGEDTHALKVQLATALRERDIASAEVTRLRKELEDIAAWNDDQIALIQKEKDRIEDPKGYLHQWEMAHKIAAHDARAALATGGSDGT